MVSSKPFGLTDKQKEQRALQKAFMVTLSEGGGRSAKTFGNWDATFIRAAAIPESDHLFARLRFSHIKASLIGQTIPRWFKARGWPQWSIPLNKSDWYYQLPNGSKIWIAGLDDEARMDKVLGRDFATIGLDEVSEIGYPHFDLLLGRLLPPEGVNGKMFLAQNPGNKRHWTHKVFHEGVFPDGRPVPKDQFASILMNPDDNPFTRDQYNKSLDMMSAARQRRFRYGEYSDDQGVLWKRTQFRYDSPPAELLRIVVGVDPSGSVEGDEIGIVVAGRWLGPEGVDQFAVLDDYSLHGTPRQWADEVAVAYNRWGADCVVAEKNFGGDMVADVIQRSSRNINVKLVTSSRGKIVRAEPVVALYEHGQVTHRIPFLPLEDEMCSYEPGKSKSPNRMDAAVFGLSELSGEGVSILDVI
jgi:hypothetical protein